MGTAGPKSAFRNYEAPGKMHCCVLRFSLTHVVVFSMLIGLLCMLHHPAQETHFPKLADGQGGMPYFSSGPSGYSPARCGEGAKGHEIHLSGTGELVHCSRVTWKGTSLVLEQLCLSEERKRREEVEKRRRLALGFK